MAKRPSADFAGVLLDFLSHPGTLILHEVRKMAVGLTDTSNKIAKTITKYYQTLKKIHIFRLQILFPHSNCQRHTGLLRGSEVTSANADRAREIDVTIMLFRVLFAVLVRVASLIQAHKLFDLI